MASVVVALCPTEEGEDQDVPEIDYFRPKHSNLSA